MHEHRHPARSASTIPQAALDDLPDRLARTLWTDEMPGSGTEYGVALSQVTRLAEHWRDEFDWRALEARLNAYPQFMTEIDGQNIHFLHVRSAPRRRSPLILTHGWPGSVARVPGRDRAAHRPTAGQPAFHLVIPSLPGFGFSGPTRSRGWDRTAPRAPGRS